MIVTYTLLVFIIILVIVVWAALTRQIEEARMATEEQFAAAFERLNTATTAVANLIRQLRDDLASGGLTPEQEADKLAKLGLAADALEAMAQNPTNPVPVPVPEPSSGD